MQLMNLVFLTDCLIFNTERPLYTDLESQEFQELIFIQYSK